MKKLTLDDLGRTAWDAYVKEVGGKAFNGDPLPSWQVMRADPAKAHLINAWIAAGAAVQQRVLKQIKETPPSPPPPPSRPKSLTAYPLPIRRLDKATTCCGARSLVRAVGHYSCPCGKTVQPFNF